MSELKIPQEFWDSDRKRWNSHAYFDSIYHHHFSEYSGGKFYDLMVVKCRDGRWYLEDNWGDEEGFKGVFNPFDKNSFPTFYQTMEDADSLVSKVIRTITGVCALDESSWPDNDGVSQVLNKLKGGSFCVQENQLSIAKIMSNDTRKE